MIAEAFSRLVPIRLEHGTEPSGLEQGADVHILLVTCSLFNIALDELRTISRLPSLGAVASRRIMEDRDHLSRCIPRFQGLRYAQLRGAGMNETQVTILATLHDCHQCRVRAREFRAK